MTRVRVAGLLAVLALLAGALVVRGSTGRPAGASPVAEVQSLRTEAALRPCPPGLGAALPDVSLPCLGGGAPVALTARGTGRPTLVNLWATWCGPCVQEVPELVAYAERFRGRVDVVGVLTTDEPRDALVFARQFGIHYPNLDDQDGALRRRYAPGVPATLLLDGSGRVVSVKLRPFTSVGEIERLVAARLGVRP